MADACASSRPLRPVAALGISRPRLLSGSTPHDPEHANAHRHEIAFHVPVHDRQRRCSLSAFLGRAMRAPINLRSSRFPSRSAPQQARQHPLARPSCVAKAAGRTISAHKIPIARGQSRVLPFPRFRSLKAFGRRPRARGNICDGPASETLHKTRPFVSGSHGSFRQLRTCRNVDAGQHWATTCPEQLQQIVSIPAEGCCMSTGCPTAGA